MTRNKFKAQKTTLDGITFDSKKEAVRYAELRMLERAGEIEGLERQVVITLEGKNRPLTGATGRPLTYRADFRYYDRQEGQWVYEDVKGYRTQEYKLKKAILAAQGVSIFET